MQNFQKKHLCKIAAHKNKCARSLADKSSGKNQLK